MLRQCDEFIKKEDILKGNLILVGADISRLLFITASVDAACWCCVALLAITINCCKQSPLCFYEPKLEHQNFHHNSLWCKVSSGLILKQKYETISKSHKCLIYQYYAVLVRILYYQYYAVSVFCSINILQGH
ncbi:putative methyltransferase, chloroplastic isoform X1 [Iris pallida]|uniref:Methyltransferase, chloroplastic isoform X1 n=1 Tax=Iris pallida TaxID=29817 RepID=A0AAX6EAN0_IRIPA|nr:putative methyltransferase, chloroplastic isoform X1 [Iris pallida]